MEAETPRSNSPMMRLVTHPITASLTFALTVIAAGVTIYSFVAGGTHRDLIYFVHPGKTAVVRTGQSSKISVQLDGRPVTEDVTAARIAIWNNGDKPIRARNLLGSRHLLITTGPDNPIIDAKILKVSRDEVVKLVLDHSEIEVGQLKVKWEILEQHDGAALQLIYFGDAQTPVTASAIVEQQGEIRALEYGGAIRTPDEQFRQGKNDKWIAYVCFALSCLLVSFGILLLRRPDLVERWRKPREGVTRFLATSLITQGTLTTILSLYLLYRLSTKLGPPFGF